jgi:hypothetical protein
LFNSSEEKPAAHGFLLMGTEILYSCHFPMFFMPEHRYQAILEVALGQTDKDIYLKKRKETPGKPVMIMNLEPMLLKDIVNSSSFSAFASFANENGDPDGDPFIASSTVSVKKSLVFNHLDPQGGDYPESLTYYLYGRDSEAHLSHLLSKAPNFQQELDVTLSGDILNKIGSSDNGPIKTSIPSLNEKSMQPIASDPLRQQEYTIKCDDDGSTGKISIGNKFWINNGPLNQSM